MNHKLTLIEKGHPKLSIREQCELLQLNRSSVYWDRKPEVSEEDIVVMNAIDELYTKRPYFGVRRITNHLVTPGITVNHKRIHRLMQVMGIQAIHPKPNLSKADKQNEVYPYLLKDVIVKYPNHVWGTDITYIKINGSWLYLVAILDWYSRYVINWDLSDSLSSEFCIENLKESLQIAQPDIHNSDQGVQFTDKDYINTLKLYPSIRISMDGRGRAMDNIFTERLWRTVKYEEVYLKEYQSPKETRQSLTEYFEFYNTERKHQSLKNQTPESVYFNKN